MEITLRIDEERLDRSLASVAQPLMQYLEAIRRGQGTEADFQHFRSIGISVAVSGYPPHAEVSDEDQAMQPLWRAVNTLNEWANAEPVTLRKRWFCMAAEAAMSMIHYAEEGQQGAMLGRWPVDEFTHRVWALALAMHERGLTAEEAWFGQEFAAVVQALETRGLAVKASECW